jgi:hypothetical protein
METDARAQEAAQCTGAAAAARADPRPPPALMPVIMLRVVITVDQAGDRPPRCP